VLGPKAPDKQSPRAQIDRALYKKHMQKTLAKYPNLHVRSGDVFDLLFNQSTSESKAQPTTTASPGATPLNSDRWTDMAGVQHLFTSYPRFFGTWSLVSTTSIKLHAPYEIDLKRFSAGRLSELPPSSRVEGLSHASKCKLRPWPTSNWYSRAS
jgi:tRNA uridine 5-carboxymethylaminomethyl modification enzyme